MVKRIRFKQKMVMKIDNIQIVAKINAANHTET